LGSLSHLDLQGQVPSHGTRSFLDALVVQESWWVWSQGGRIATYCGSVLLPSVILCIQ
jgi:hypothetical protein